MFYVRYRHGWLTIELSKSITQDVYKAMGEDAELLFSEAFGDSYDGVLSDSEFKEKMEGCGFIFN